MARPIKKNAEYFSHDADMRNDPKIKAIRTKFGHLGFAVWVFLLEVLTDSDDFIIEWDDLTIEILAGDFNCSADELRAVVDYAVTLKLLSVTPNQYLKCEKLIERFDGLLTKRGKDRKRVFASENPQVGTQNGVIASENPAQGEFSLAKNPQSKVKESKVNNIPPYNPPKGDDERDDGCSKKQAPYPDVSVPGDTAAVFSDKLVTEWNDLYKIHKTTSATEKAIGYDPIILRAAFIYHNISKHTGYPEQVYAKEIIDEIRKLNEPTPEIMNKVCEFALKDSFWKTKVSTVKDFAKHYAKLRLQYTTKQQKSKPVFAD